MKDGEPYPYPVHTNRELDMMLAGTKPFAVFARERVNGFEKADALGDQDFETYVANGTMSEHVRTFECHRPDGTPLDIDYYFYAVDGEAWRVEAYCLLLEMLNRGNWCSHLEWLEGKLLGYTDDQNRYHLSRTYGKDSTDCQCPKPQ